jgi:hypothetical protein
VSESPCTSDEMLLTKSSMQAKARDKP